MCVGVACVWAWPVGIWICQDTIVTSYDATCVGVACGILEVSRTVDSGTHNHALATCQS